MAVKSPSAKVMAGKHFLIIFDQSFQDFLSFFCPSETRKKWGSGEPERHFRLKISAKRVKKRPPCEARKKNRVAPFREKNCRKNNSFSPFSAIIKNSQQN
jgi:hypothetical protein